MVESNHVYTWWWQMTMKTFSNNNNNNRAFEKGFFYRTRIIADRSQTNEKKNCDPIGCVCMFVCK